MRASLTIFSIGFALLSAISINGQERSFKSAVPTIDFCKIFDDNSNDGKLIRTEAILYYSNVPRVDGDDTMLYSPRCDNEDDHVFVYLTEAAQTSGLWNAKNFPVEKDYHFRVLFEGRPEQALVPTYGQLGWAINQIKIDKIISYKDASDDKELISSKTETESPRYERARRLAAYDEYFINSLFDSKLMREGPNSVAEMLSNDFVFTDLRGDTIYKKDFLALKEPILIMFADVKPFPKISHGRREIKKEKECVTTVGFLEFEYSENKITKINYEITFRLEKNFWIIMRAKISKD